VVVVVVVVVVVAMAVVLRSDVSIVVAMCWW